VTSPRQHQFIGLAGWLGITIVAAALGAVASAGAPAFYGALAKPAWAPPPGVFGPVWTVLYLLMAVAVWLVWRVRGFATAPRTLALYLVQLAANALWSWLFFRWHLGLAAVAEVVVLWALVAATVAAFRRVHPLAAWLMAPYLLWVTFASALTIAVWRANPQLLGT
jgi:tryptophan-rich sensory protein